MPIIAKGSNSKPYEPAPSGAQVAVCVDVVDIGLVENVKFPNADGTAKWQHKIDIVWESSETMSDGRPFLINKRYTLSLNEKATLRHDLASWRGRDFTEAELEAFDIENLLGVNAILNVVHKTGSKGGTYANVAAVMPMMKGTPKIVPTGDYIRVCKRVPEQNPTAEAPSEDDIPF